MAKHVSVQPDKALGECPECGLPYYHVLRHVGGQTTYIHSDVDVLATGIDVEYCYVEKLPTSATVEAWVTIEMYQGSAENCTLFFNENKARADYLQSMEAFSRDHPEWEEERDLEFYCRLYDTGDFDSEVYLNDVEIKKEDLPYHGMAMYLSTTLYDVMLWALKDAGVTDVRDPNRTRAAVYTSALRILAKAYEEFKGYGLRKLDEVFDGK